MSHKRGEIVVLDRAAFDRGVEAAMEVHSIARRLVLEGDVIAADRLPRLARNAEALYRALVRDGSPHAGLCRRVLLDVQAQRDDEPEENQAHQEIYRTSRAWASVDRWRTKNAAAEFEAAAA